MSQAAFTTILIANRGEIACRVIEAARQRGYATVAVYSDPDAQARHVTMADRAVAIGGSTAAESYLVIDKIIDAARASGADAIHPGYGFLSENAAFADVVVAAGMIFVGPPPAAIRAMGNKAAAKRLMIDAGVRCVPGYQNPDQSDERLIAAAGDIGVPIMVKAAAGGGGRGMRLVHDLAALPAAIIEARREAASAFGSDELILERAVIRPRHVEIQVFADSHGNAVHFGERDCSVQRRNQKVLEEAPSPALGPELRAEMGEAAVRAARAIDYRGAGTVEFLLDEGGGFYFLEMNTRIQVEHPVTELVTGQDLVAMQLDVAAGLPLPVTQDQVVLRGHAIEARLYAEDPTKDFLPQTGTVLAWRPASGPGVRFDHGLVESAPVSSFYDPMLAKVIAHGATREEARRRLTRALEQMTLLGVATNRAFLLQMLRDPVFADGGATTDFIASRFPVVAGPDEATLRLARAIGAALLVERAKPAGELGNWWSTGCAVSRFKLAVGETATQLTVRAAGDRYTVEEEADDAAGAITELTVVTLDPDSVAIRLGATTQRFDWAQAGDTVFLSLGDEVVEVRDDTYAPAVAAEAGSDGVLRAPMNGAIVAVHVAAGDNVKRGDPLLVLEAMKMTQPMVAPMDGVIDTVLASAGDQVANRQPLIRMSAA